MTLTDHVLDIAGSQVGVREKGGPNRGPEVDRYLAAVRLAPGQPWCAAFVSWCYLMAMLKLKPSAEVGVINVDRDPCPLRTSGSALHLWEKAPPEQRSQTPSPGAIFVIDHSGGKGHCGFVEHIITAENDDEFWTKLVTIEGNTNDSGGREGDGVYRRERLLPIPGLVGYIIPSRSLGAIPEELRA